MADSDDETSAVPGATPNTATYTPVLPSISKPIYEGMLVKSPANADRADPDRSTGMHAWRERYFVLVPGSPQVYS